MIRLTNEAIEFRLRDEEMIEFGGDLTWYEREQMRARTLERRQPISVLIDLQEASATDFMLYLLTLPREKRDEVLTKVAPQLEKLAAMRRQTYRMAQRALKAQRKNGNGHAN